AASGPVCGQIQTRKITVQFRQARNGGPDVRSIFDAPSFIIHQPEGLVSSVEELGNINRSARDKSELILTQFCFYRLRLTWQRIGNNRYGIQCVVPAKIKNRAMDVIAATPANQVDLIGTETELRRIGFGLHFEFLNGVLG